MRAMLSSSFLALLLLGACDTSSPPPPARLQLAQVCAVAEIEARAATPELATDTGSDLVIDDPGIGDPPPPPPPPPPTDDVPLACCVSETGAPVTCVPMDYDDLDCQAVAERPEATVLTEYTVGTYTGTAIPNAYFGCDGGNDDPNNQCQEGDGAYVLQVQGAVAVIEFIEDDQIRIYDLDGETVVRTEDGGELHAVVAAGHGYADPTKPVYRNGVLIGYANYQTDWLPNGCGHTGNIC